MLKIYCPYCQQNLEEEDFSYAGEAFIVRPEKPDTLSDEEWGDYLFMRKNPKAKHWEQWQHSAACRKYFVVQRNTIDNKIYASFTMDKARKAANIDEIDNATN